MCEQNIGIAEPDKKTKAKSIGFIILHLLIVAGFVAIGPKLFSSAWVSSSDFHSCIEICSSFIAIIAAVACLMYYFGLKKRYYLICGLGFFICGGEDFIHGLLSFVRLFSGIEGDLSKFVPGTYVAGRSMFAIFIILAAGLGDRFRPTKNVRKETLCFSLVAMIVACGATALAIMLPLPRFIYPEQLISRPVDFASAVLFAIAFAMVLKRYLYERSVFSGFLLSCILLNLGGQIYMSFSKQLFDAFFDTAHLANILSYCMPVLGITIQALKEMKNSERELIIRRHAEKALQEHRHHLEEVVQKRTSELKTSNKGLKAEVTERKLAEEQLKHTQAELQKQVTELVEAWQAALNMMEDINQEITERKQAEENVRLAYEELEKTNKELKEVQSQMVQSEKLASIGRLAAGVAHEMNTPVGFVASNFQTLEDYIKKIQGLLEMDDELIGRIKTAQKTELLNKANAISKFREDMKIDFVLEDIQGLFDDSKEGMARVTSIIQNLRDFSRVDLPGSLDEYNLNDGIKTTLVVANSEIKYDAIVKTKLSEIPLTLCDSGLINQVFLNIILNAAQAIKAQEREDKGIITVRTYAADDDVVCEICDDGPGIPPDKLQKVFDPFYTTKPAGEGTGLGLSISYDIIVIKHNGKLLVESTVGKGTKFTIKLPIVRKEQNDEKVTENNGNVQTVAAATTPSH